VTSSSKEDTTALTKPSGFPAGTVWCYFDKTNDLSTSWRSNTFNDATY
jgi:hypothetical protein